MGDVHALRAMAVARQFEPLIRHIRFPHYKNLVEGTKIDFSFPLTALVGPNGTNKSSVLRAMFGAPRFNNLGNLWFSTSIDPIEDSGKRSCFVYGYWNSARGILVEVLKTRIFKEGDPDYWEPSRPLLEYGMEKMPPYDKSRAAAEKRSKTRWNAIDKNVVYLDFRATLSAFDKFFYHGELRGRPSTEREKKELIRRRAPHLKRAIDDKLTSYEFRKKERIVNGENSVLTNDQLSQVSNILGRDYEEIVLTRHTFYDCDAYTCRMKTSNMRYTEAFAGSGEFAVVRLVHGVMTAPERSLILLDEPEVSLHPGAQERLVGFLLKQIKERRHQVVMSTHAPAIVRSLPKDAIKVFAVDPTTGHTAVPQQSWLPEEAFFHLGERRGTAVTVVVEDVLAKAIVNWILAGLEEATRKQFEVVYYPGGAETLWAYYAPIFAAENRRDVLILFDGDKRPVTPMVASNTISDADANLLATEIRRVSGVDIRFNVDGHGNAREDQRLEMRRKFIDWAGTSVAYLSGAQSPEQFVWENMRQDELSAKCAGSFKERFEQLARLELGLNADENVSADDILATQRRRLATAAIESDAINEIRVRLQAALEFATQEVEA